MSSVDHQSKPASAAQSPKPDEGLAPATQSQQQSAAQSPKPDEGLAPATEKHADPASDITVTAPTPAAASPEAASPREQAIDAQPVATDAGAAEADVTGEDAEIAAAATAQAEEDTKKEKEWVWQGLPPDEAVWVDADDAEMDDEERRPATPQRNYDLREQHADLVARIAQRRIDLAEAQANLASKRSKEAIAADMKVAMTAIAVAEEATAAAQQRTATAKELLAAARAIAARLQRVEQYAARATHFVDTDVTDACNKATEEARDRVALDVLEELRGFKYTRDRELGAIAALQDEKRENTRILAGPREVIHSPIAQQLAASQQEKEKQQSSGARSPSKSMSASKDESAISPTKSGAATSRSQIFSARSGVVASPGEARVGDVQPLPPPPAEVELAALDLQDYLTMNNEAKEQLDAIKKQRQAHEQERLALQRKSQMTKRRIEAELHELAYQQRHESHSLAAKRKRVAELEASNSSLMSSLQYTHASLKMTWTPSVRDYFIQAGSNPAPAASTRRQQRSSTSPVSASASSSPQKPAPAATQQQQQQPVQQEEEHHEVAAASHDNAPIAPAPEQHEPAASVEQAPIVEPQQA